MVMPSITICIFLTLTNSFKLFDQNLCPDRRRTRQSHGDAGTEHLRYLLRPQRRPVEGHRPGQGRGVLLAVVVIALIQLAAVHPFQGGAAVMQNSQNHTARQRRDPVVLACCALRTSTPSCCPAQLPQAKDPAISTTRFSSCLPPRPLWGCRTISTASPPWTFCPPSGTVYYLGFVGLADLAVLLHVRVVHHPRKHGKLVTKHVLPVRVLHGGALPDGHVHPGQDRR